MLRLDMLICIQRGNTSESRRADTGAQKAVGKVRVSSMSADLLTAHYGKFCCWIPFKEHLFFITTNQIWIVDVKSRVVYISINYCFIAETCVKHIEMGLSFLGPVCCVIRQPVSLNRVVQAMERLGALPPQMCELPCACLFSLHVAGISVRPKCCIA